MNYKVVVVEDDELPTTAGWVLVRTRCGVFLCIKRSCSTWDTGLADVLTAAWHASAINGTGLPLPLLEAV